MPTHFIIIIITHFGWNIYNGEMEILLSISETISNMKLTFSPINCTFFNHLALLWNSQFVIKLTKTNKLWRKYILVFYFLPWRFIVRLYNTLRSLSNISIVTDWKASTQCRGDNNKRSIITWPCDVTSRLGSARRRHFFLHGLVRAVRLNRRRPWPLSIAIISFPGRQPVKALQYTPEGFF